MGIGGEGIVGEKEEEREEKSEEREREERGSVRGFLKGPWFRGGSVGVEEVVHSSGGGRGGRGGGGGGGKRSEGASGQIKVVDFDIVRII